jgi:hypothetical protein
LERYFIHKDGYGFLKSGTEFGRYSASKVIGLKLFLVGDPSRSIQVSQRYMANLVRWAMTCAHCSARNDPTVRLVFKEQPQTCCDVLAFSALP